ncbi:MAG: hypothetical protein ACE5HT_04745 [Gemmatimonadales bacterium]
MIRSSRRLEELERRHQSEALERLTYAEALETFTALWVEARALGASGRNDWKAELDSSLAVARAVNGLSPIT